MTEDARSSAAAEHHADRSAQPGKYLTFKLSSTEYALPILAVREIVGRPQLTRVPGAPKFLRGVANLRGKVIPVMDLRLRMGMEPAEGGEQSVVVVVDGVGAGRALVMGLLVDDVVEVLWLGAGELSPPPDLGLTTAEAEIGARFLLGVGQADARVLFLLDLAGVLTDVAG